MTGKTGRKWQIKIVPSLIASDIMLYRSTMFNDGLSGALSVITELATIGQIGGGGGEVHKRAKGNFYKGGENLENRKMSERALEARRRYMAEWRKNNRDRIRRSNTSYWERRAKRMEAGEHDKS